MAASKHVNFFDLDTYLAHSINEFKVLIYALFMYLKIDVESITILASLMCIDTLFGAIKVIRINYKEFRLRKLMLGFVSKMAFLLLPIVVALAGKGLGYDLKIIVEVSIKLLIASEAISIFSNGIAIRTKQDVYDYDIITGFLKHIRTVFIKFADALLTTLKGK